MCVKCEPFKSTNTKLTHREVPIKLIQLVHEEKQRIKSFGETVVKVEWFHHIDHFFGYITFRYSDGCDSQIDYIQVSVKG